MNSSQLMSWLEQAGARKIHTSGTEVASTCPFHKDNSPSFSVNANTGLFICYSAKCGVQGNLVNLLMGALGWSFKKAKSASNKLGLIDITDVTKLKLPEYLKRFEVEQPEVVISEGYLGLYDFCPKSMLERGYSKKVLRRWEVGYDYGSARVTIPVRDAEGRLIGITKRSTRDWQTPKYLHLGFKKADHLYGAHRPTEAAADLLVVEGQTDVLSLWQEAQEQLRTHRVIPVSTMGARVGRGQVQKMAQRRRVILAFDDDADGRAATLNVGDRLVNKLRPGHLLVARNFSGRKDPGELLGASRSEINDFFMFENYTKVRLELVGQNTRRMYG